MSDPTAEYAANQQLGRLERRVPIRGALRIGEGAQAEAELCLTARGLWLIAAKDAQIGRADDLLAVANLQYVKGKKTDELRFNDVIVEVTTAKRADALEAIALARLRGGGPRPLRPLLPARHVETPSPVERAVLERWIAPDEFLLAHVRTTFAEPAASSVLGDATASLVFVLTERRAALLGSSEAGDFVGLELARGPVDWDGSSRSLTLDGRRFALARKEISGTELAALVPLDPHDRLLAAARYNWLDRSSKAERLAASRTLLDALSRRDHAVGHVAQFLVSEELDEPRPARPSLDGAVEALDKTETPPLVLADLWRSFQFSVNAGRSALEQLRAQGTNEILFELHAALRDGEVQSADEEEAAILDADLAEHALALGKADRAQAILEHRLVALPTRPLDEIAPVTRRSAEWIAIRARLLELLAAARGTEDRPDVPSLCDLARLQPLSADRLDALARAAIRAPAGSLSQRASGALATLTGSIASNERLLPQPKEPLSDPLLAILRVSTGADVAALFGVLQTFVASSALPDRSLIRDYCEELPNDGIAGQAIIRAARALGLENVGGYVSRGRKDIGVRAYDARPPYLLVGGRHLDPGEFHLSEAELCFTIGAELAHVRFDHARVTSEQVWEGALNKGKQGLDTVLGVLPMIRGLSAAGRFSKLAAHLESQPIRKAVQSAQAVNEAIQRALSLTSRPDQSDESDAITASNEKLIVAHRFVQLSADRVGLVLAADIVSAVRAILLTRRDYARALPDIEKNGLASVLRDRVEARDPAFSDLAVRLAALIAFYLSEEYVRVAEGVGGTQGA